ncbi:YicC family protein [Orrella sp. NBD-18]|uniref:YicC family protein n=1 Tax=Sheuella amnicola TaxID=2707330 RepID=A0A6B2QXX4_9BURK|nr:YicC/YloC family endoribonuclease [Sheuella amnicola]NDY81969.1 YicC family protein [Sheuella amnicola]
MTASMTAFGQGKATMDFGSVTVELKSVNSRYLDIQFRMPDELRFAEQPMRDRISKSLARGKVEVRASFARNVPALEQRLTEQALTNIADQLSHVRRYLPETNSPQLPEIISLASDQQQTAIDPQLWANACMQALEPALVQLTEARLREGSRLAMAMLETSKQVCEIVIMVESHLPELLQQQREKLSNKLRETIQNAFPSGFTHISGAELSERIAGESSLFSLRIDVAEELARLKSHLSELEFLLSEQKTKSTGKNSGSTGKRLDFLFQEMNREANTLGSKAGSLEMTRAAMDLKLLIEQMREQAMNIE